MARASWWVVSIVVAVGACSGSGSNSEPLPQASELTSTMTVGATPLTWPVIEERDISYTTGLVGATAVPTERELQLDLFHPDGAPPGRVGVVLAHGGSFITGDRSEFHDLARFLTARGHVVATITYRLTGDDPMPTERFAPALDFVGGDDAGLLLRTGVAGMEDLVDAVEWLQEHADAYEVDPHRIVIGGSSAGAVASLYVGYGSNDFGIDAPDVAGVIDLAGGFLLHPGKADLLDEGEPALFLAHSTGDPVMPFSFAQDLIDRTDELGHPASVHVLPGQDHLIQLGSSYDEAVPLNDILDRWLQDR